MFHREGPARETAQVPAFVLTLGTASSSELCRLAGMIIACKNGGCLDKRAWPVIVYVSNMMRNRTRSQYNDVRSGTE